MSTTHLLTFPHEILVHSLSFCDPSCAHRRRTTVSFACLELSSSFFYEDAVLKSPKAVDFFLCDSPVSFSFSLHTLWVFAAHILLSDHHLLPFIPNRFLLLPPPPSPNHLPLLLHRQERNSMLGSNTSKGPTRAGSASSRCPVYVFPPPLPPPFAIFISVPLLNSYPSRITGVTVISSSESGADFVRL